MDASRFRRSGYFCFDYGEKETCELEFSLRDIISPLKASLVKGYCSRESLSCNNIPRHILESVARRFNELELLKKLHGGFGAEPNLSGFSIEISAPNASWWSRRIYRFNTPTPPRTPYFHRDETCYVPKAILYLCDVTKDNGPFSVCPKSIRQETFEVTAAASRVSTYPMNTPGNTISREQLANFRTLLPVGLQVDSHYGYNVPDDSKISRDILSDEISFCEKKGSGIVFDGYNLLHRGGLCTSYPRIALQIMLPVAVPNLQFWMDLAKSHLQVSCL